jgi:hypothetical protein
MARLNFNHLTGHYRSRPRVREWRTWPPVTRSRSWHRARGVSMAGPRCLASLHYEGHEGTKNQEALRVRGGIRRQDHNHAADPRPQPHESVARLRRAVPHVVDHAHLRAGVLSAQWHGHAVVSAAPLHERSIAVSPGARPLACRRRTRPGAVLRVSVQFRLSHHAAARVVGSRLGDDRCAPR